MEIEPGSTKAEGGVTEVDMNVTSRSEARSVVTQHTERSIMLENLVLEKQHQDEIDALKYQLADRKKLLEERHKWCKQVESNLKLKEAECLKLKGMLEAQNSTDAKMAELTTRSTPKFEDENLLDGVMNGK